MGSNKDLILHACIAFLKTLPLTIRHFEGNISNSWHLNLYNHQNEGFFLALCSKYIGEDVGGRDRDFINSKI